MIKTENFSKHLRARAIDVEGGRLLMTDLRGSQQELDLSLPPNCHGFGRVHRFHRRTSVGWPENPLPLEPASRALGWDRQESMAVQVFQNAACNWRCWYCYVDFALLSANLKHSAFVSAAQLVEWYLQLPERPVVIDLSGGQPDLVPEWIPWMMDALAERGLSEKTFLWSDDNLSTDYFWRFLSEQQRNRIASYGNYARVCCFKGFDAESFSFNTKAEPDLFNKQFELFGRLLSAGLDLYAYVTLTGPSLLNIREKVGRFCDELQQIHPNLPLRTIPLEIRSFTPLRNRLPSINADAEKVQKAAIEAWTVEIERRFSSDVRLIGICDVQLS
ncbi:MAG: hypothetical protein H0X34_07435 [Chthoniobacterales bacterium]|nr:hypothetical protein [Chthoniobacterales bacterium]